MDTKGTPPMLLDQMENLRRHPILRTEQKTPNRSLA